MKDNKRALRARTLSFRESFSPSELSLWSRLIQTKVLRLSLYVRSRSVALYSPIGGEVKTEEIRDHAFSVGKKVFYPKLGAGKGVDLIRVQSAEELVPGRYGILEPKGSETMAKQDRDGLILFVPGLAFDLQGNRLGRGKGWYDRVLKLLGGGVAAVALAYEFQIVAELPADEWDRKMRYIITERRIIDCGNLASQTRWIS